MQDTFSKANRIALGVLTLTLAGCPGDDTTAVSTGDDTSTGGDPSTSSPPTTTGADGSGTTEDSDPTTRTGTDTGTDTTDTDATDTDATDTDATDTDATSTGSTDTDTDTDGTSTGSTGTGGAMCGNDTIEDAEVCDGLDLAGEDCVSQGFPSGGELGCAMDCSGFDTSACVATSCEDEDIGEMIGAAVTMGDTTGDDDTLNPSCGGAGGNDRAILFTAPADGTYIFDTFGSGYDTSLSLFANCDAAADIICNDDAGGVLQSQVVYEMTMGESVIVLVDGFNGATGAWTLNITDGGLCGNDTIEGFETCDGADLAGADCTSLGASGDGPVTCLADCSGYDTSACDFVGDCCLDNGSPGCVDQTCTTSICDADPFCCDTQWDQVCADAALADPNCDMAGGACEAVCGNDLAESGEACDGMDLAGEDCTSLGLAGDGPITCLGDCSGFDTSACDFGGDCCANNGTPGCEDQTCTTSICDADPFCCNTNWDQLCADAALVDPECAGVGGSCPAAALPCADEDIGSATGALVSTGTTVGDDNDVNGSCGNGDGEDRAISFTATTAGDYTFDTIGSDFNTELSIWSSCDAGSELACNDNIGMGNQQSEVTVTMEAGQQVLVNIDGFNGATGNYVLNITAPPLDLTCSEGTGMAPNFMGTNAAEDDTLIESCSGAMSSPDSVYEYTATVAGVHTFDAIGSDFDTALGVFLDCGGTEIACNDDFAGNPDCGTFPCSQLDVDLEIGETVLLSIAGFNGATGNWVINVTEP